MPTIFKVFISYSSEDLRIAQQLRRALMLFDVNHIEVFHDAVNIRTGANWRDLLVTKLNDSEWLIAVHTGEHRLSFSFPGWEVGVFEQTLKNKSENARVFCLFDTRQSPDLFSEKQNRKIPVPTSCPQDKTDYYRGTHLGVFLDDFVAAYKAIVPAEERNDDVYLEQQKLPAAYIITRAFWDCQQDDIQEQAFPQHRITIRIDPSSPSPNNGPGIPDEAALTIDSSTNTALGIESRYDSEQNLIHPSWGQLRNLLSSNVDWMDRVNEVLNPCRNDRISEIYHSHFRFSVRTAV